MYPKRYDLYFWDVWGLGFRAGGSVGLLDSGGMLIEVLKWKIEEWAAAFVI